MKEPFKQLKAWTVEVPHYRDTIITAATSRDSARRQTIEALRWDTHTPAWIEIRVLRAPQYDALAAKAYKEHLALGEINGQTGQVTLHGWARE